MLAIYKYSIGNTWEPELLEFVKKMNETHERTQITTLYGNTTISPLGNARSRPRTQQIGGDEVSAFITEAHKIGLKINWTMNVSCLGDIRDFLDKWRIGLRAGVLSFIEYYDIDIITVAHPLLFFLLGDALDNLPPLSVELSTIAGVTEVEQVQWYFDACRRFDRICVPIARNLDRQWLSKLKRYQWLTPEVIVNEFCHLGKFGNCDGIFRRTCYDMNAHQTQLKDPYYPRALCTKIRANDPVSWLQANWILPQDIPHYSAVTGVESFKITGRTHPTAFLKRIVPYYMDLEFDGNLLELWPHLQTIGRALSDDEFEEEQRKIVKTLNFPAKDMSKLFEKKMLSTDPWARRQLCERYYKGLNNKKKEQ